jgi:hypothetical protein
MAVLSITTVLGIGLVYWCAIVVLSITTSRGIVVLSITTSRGIVVLSITTSRGHPGLNVRMRF